MTPLQFLRWKDYKSLELLYKYDFTNPEELDQPRYPCGCVTNIILDDCLASNAFSSRRGSTLLKSVLNGRHYGINMFICAQNLKSINKAIRGNTEVWILFRFCSMKIILDDLYEEISALLTEEEFLELYQYATIEDHDAFVIDKKAEKGNIFKNNLDIVLQQNKNKNINDK